MEYKKVPQQINDIVGDNVKLLAQVFPSAVKDGQVDFEALREELGEFEEVGTEKYDFTWTGKQESKQLAQQDIFNRTLNYIPEDSKNGDTTENLYIEGDNLEVLKVLRQNYYNSIKMIYIDPPYNTDDDRIYNDKFKMNNVESDIKEGIRDEEGSPLQKNSKSSNRYHAKWLNMMYPRLRLAKDLLIDDGVIFISIDDNEVHNLKKLCDEVFGQGNFVAQINIVTGANQSGEGVLIQKNTEYCLCYAKNINDTLLYRVDKTEESYRNLNDAPTSLSTRLDMGYTIYYNEISGDMIPLMDYNKDKVETNDINKIYSDNKKLLSQGYIPIRAGFRNGKIHRWRWGFDTFLERKNEIKIFKNNNKYIPKFLQSGYNAAKNIWNYSGGKIDLKNLFDDNSPFDYPKGVLFLKYICSITTSNEDYILDFFSGSATTAHAVMQLNAEDGGNRKFIMVQYPELTDEKTEAYKAGYKNICEIGKERIRRAGEKIKQDIEESNKQIQIGEEPKKVPDIGFKVFRTSDTNIKWNYQQYEQIKSTFENINNLDLIDFTPDFKDIDIVYEIMLRQKNVPLSSTVETLTDIGERTYLYASSYLICLETEITENLIDKLAMLDPLPIKFVFRDSAFKDDIDLKDETFRRLKSMIERNLGVTKHTYNVEFI